MYNRKKGITLVELIIVIAILSIVFTAICSFFLADYKAINKVQIELELQSEGEKAIEQISNIAIQSSGMDYSVINNIKFIKENIEYNFIYEINDKKLYLIVNDVVNNKIEIAKYIENITYDKVEVKNEIEQDGKKKEEIKIIGVELNIQLKKKNVNKHISTKVYFRNVNLF